MLMLMQLARAGEPVTSGSVAPAEAAVAAAIPAEALAQLAAAAREPIIVVGRTANADVPSSFAPIRKTTVRSS